MSDEDNWIAEVRRVKDHLENGDRNQFSVVEEWRPIEGHPKYEISNLGVIRHVVSKKIRNEPNGGFRYYRDGVRRSIPIHILLDRAFPNGH